MSKGGNKIFSSAVRKWLLRLLGVAVLLAFCYHVHRLTATLDWSEFSRALARPERWKYLVLAILLMPVNWLLEAKKWHLLLQGFLPWSFQKTLKATIAGVTVSAATPNRVGEIGGRMTLATKEEWPAVVTSSILGSACQWIAFLLLAWPGLMWTAGPLVQARIGFPVVYLWPLGPVVLVVGFALGKGVLLGIAKYLNGRWGLDNTDLIAALRQVKAGLIVHAGCYACLRFSVYCMQLYVLLRFFGLALPLLKTLAGIAGIYLVQAGIPLPPGVNLALRSELGIQLWGGSAGAAAATVLAFATLFIVNVLLPALPGYWAVAQTTHDADTD